MKIKQPLKAWLKLAKPDEIIAEVRRRIRVALGDKIENETKIIARNGYYFIAFPKNQAFARFRELLTWTEKDSGSPVGLRRRNLEPFFKALRKLRKA